MAERIEDYALLSDGYSAALVSKSGSIDWLAFPSFDSPACFANLIGDENNGRWRIAPKDNFSVKRKYIEDSVVLETEFKTDSGKCTLIDCMLMDDCAPTLLRKVVGNEGTVELHLDFILRFDYGSIIPWVRKNKDRDGIHAIGGPEAAVLYSPIDLHGKNLCTRTNFIIHEGETLYFTLTWYNSHETIPPKLKNPEQKLQSTIKRWQNWMSKCTYKGFDQSSVKRSLITLKALTYEPTGAIIAAPTTSLPETIGGNRNWDYRYGWIRDSSFTLEALLKGGYIEEAKRWEEWLLRALAGTPSEVNIMYGLRGERRLTEITLPWLKGYENSTPVRIGNKAFEQFQLDVFGELLSTSVVGIKNGLAISDDGWRIGKEMIKYVSNHWHEPDEGIWEVRGPKRQFTHSKLMAWVALNCAVELVTKLGMKGDATEWIILRDKIHREICEKGFNTKLNSFVQSFGSNHLDASLLMMGHVNFLPPNDPRMIGTVKAIQENLMKDGHVLRYDTASGVDGLEGRDGSFIACSFWLVDNLRMMGRVDEAKELYFHIQSIRNDLGLYSEEYSIENKRLVGNFPQAFSHIAEATSAMGFSNTSIEK